MQTFVLQIHVAMISELVCFENSYSIMKMIAFVLNIISKYNSNMIETCCFQILGGALFRMLGISVPAEREALKIMRRNHPIQDESK